MSRVVAWILVLLLGMSMIAYFALIFLPAGRA